MFNTKCQNKMPKQTASRDSVIDTMRTVFWYEGLRLYLRAPTAYALERRIEPESFGENQDGIPIHRNKWSKYRRGLHTPSESLVKRADQLVSGSARELNHVLWKALRMDLSATENAHDWLRQVSPELQIILFQRDDFLYIDSGSRFLRKLEHRASLDTLASLTILLRVNYEDGLHERVWKYAHQVLRMLLILGRTFIGRGIADALFHLYIERIFSLATWKGRQFLLADYDYLRQVDLLYHFAHHAASINKQQRPTWAELVHCMRKIMDVHVGQDLKLTLEIRS